MTPIHAQDPALLLEAHFRQTAGQNGPLNPRFKSKPSAFRGIWATGWGLS